MWPQKKAISLGLRLMSVPSWCFREGSCGVVTLEAPKDHVTVYHWPTLGVPSGPVPGWERSVMGATKLVDWEDSLRKQLSRSLGSPEIGSAIRVAVRAEPPIPAQTTGVSNPRRWGVLVLMVRIWGVSRPSHIGYRVSPALTCRLRSPPGLPSAKETISLGSESCFPSGCC